MVSIRQYLLSIIIAAIICSILISITDKKGSQGTVVKLLCGLFLAMTMLSPLTDINVLEYSSAFQVFQNDAECYVNEGKQIARDEMAAVIKRQTEAYILDKASSMGVKLTVEVKLSDTDPPKPYFVTISGAVSPYIKKQLVEWIAKDFAVSEEYQKWN